ncbi:putative membrane protein [Campylobacter blaseri]|uniref:Uncharacterized protein n=1 Tax=Campylobacter blaseri TaxID=2042961 RepID=A0A2P8QZW1_9BACT|nr:hypothetical protein [Campylobacter blaseri]PSM51787.1 hypothetical protein CQ405_06575 [Campylobacter blaseri]PSM53578.1 hypothetical protein CRN67_06580 [Campylobacter blaseri]QKF86389.1 putative membrane protein [Campylobacter blaseri]
MEGFISFLVVYRAIITAAVLTLSALILIIKFWDKIKFWWLCFWISFPLFGIIARSYKDKNFTDNENSVWHGWTSAETTLCDRFYRYYKAFMSKDERTYEKSKSYLNKIEEIDRKKFPIFMMVIIFLLVILEALGFSYVLAGWTIPGASESLQEKGAVGIAFVISVILVGFTHFTGSEIYVNSLRTKIRDFQLKEQAKYNKEIELISNPKVSLENDYVDDDEPRCLQMYNRLANKNANATPAWVVSIITAVLITLIAIGATYVRGQVLEKQLNQEISSISTNIYNDFSSELSKIQESADNQALQEQQGADRKAGWATFIVLAVLFVFIQILGILFGYKWGFAGKESEKAFNITHMFIDKNDYIQFWERKRDSIKTIANEKLNILKSKEGEYITKANVRSHTSNNISQNSSRTFEKYISIKENEHAMEQKQRMKNNSEISEKNIENKPVNEIATDSKNIIETNDSITSQELSKKEMKIQTLKDLINEEKNKENPDENMLRKYKEQLGNIMLED